MYVVFESVAFPCSIPDEYGISDMTVNLTEKDICSGRLDSTQRKIFQKYIFFIKLNRSITISHQDTFADTSNQS